MGFSSVTFQSARRYSLSALVMLLLSMCAGPVLATGEIQGTVVWRVDNPFPPYGFNLFPDQDQACLAFSEYVSRIHNQPVSSIEACYPAGGGYVQLNTVINTVSSNGEILRWTYAAGIANTACPSNSYPQTSPSMENGTVIAGRCACHTDTAPDPTGTTCALVDSCLPPNAIDPETGKCGPKCLIDLASTEITDPVAKLYEDGTYNSTDKPDLEHLNQATRNGLACIQQRVEALNCYMTPRATSGYRPTAYQQHIRNVYDNWMKIKDDTSAACADKKRKAETEFNKHKPFARRPGSISNHSQLDAAGNPAGNAVDISGVPDNTYDSADAIAAQCNMRRPLMNMPNPADNDPIHYQPE